MTVSPPTAAPAAAPSPPPADLARRRRRARLLRAARRVLVAAAALGLLAGLAWLVFFSPVLAVERADVRGVAVLDEAEVVRAAQVPVGRPLARVDLAAIAARVEDLAPVASVQVTRGWPQAVRIEVTERTAVAAVDRDGTWRGLDTDGVLFRDYPRKPPGLPVVTMQAATSTDALAEAAAVVQALPEPVLRRLDDVEVATVDDLTLQLRGGAVVVWGSAEQAADKAAVLELLIRQPARVYDVSVPGRPTVRR